MQFHHRLCAYQLSADIFNTHFFRKYAHPTNFPFTQYTRMCIKIVEWKQLMVLKCAEPLTFLNITCPLKKKKKSKTNLNFFKLLKNTPLSRRVNAILTCHILARMMLKDARINWITCLWLRGFDLCRDAVFRWTRRRKSV